VGARFFASVQTGPVAHPASCTKGTGSFPGVKRPGYGADHPPPSSVEVKKEIGLYLYFPSGPSGLLQGTFTFLVIPSPLNCLFPLQTSCQRLVSAANTTIIVFQRFTGRQPCDFFIPVIFTIINGLSTGRCG
jgi:hypothetical protein